MDRQAQIDAFLLQAHRLAVARLRQHPERLADAQAVLAKWRAQAGVTRSDAYWDEWSLLLSRGVDAIEQAACNEGEHATVLRSVSPLSPLITQKERSELLRAARAAA